MVNIYIQTQTSEQIGIITENEKIKEIIIDRPGIHNQVGNIYVGRVKVIEKSLQAAFIDFGHDKLGFLQRNEIPSVRKSNLSIESVITEGEKIIVQVEKDAYEGKGARLTANVTVPGINIVYLPYGNYIAASRKISSDRKDQLREVVNRIRTEEEGAIIRTSAEKKSVEEIEQEFERLRYRWKTLEKKAQNVKPPYLLFQDAVSDRLIRRFSSTEVGHIYVDRAELANSIRTNYPIFNEKVTKVHNIESDLPYSISKILEEAVAPKVITSHGVELVIEQVEALTVIDVNTAGFVGKGAKEQTILHANIHAAKEIAHQLRLRNLSGIIIIDFIGMKSNDNQQQVLMTLRKELSKDPIRTEVYGFTKLGLVEMTRKRESYTLPYLLLDKESNHIRFSKMTNVYALERELISYKQSNAETLLVEINPKLLKLFLETIPQEELQKVVRQDVYMKKTNSIATYKITLAGSHSLVMDYIDRNSGDAIDKVF